MSGEWRSAWDPDHTGLRGACRRRADTSTGKNFPKPRDAPLSAPECTEMSADATSRYLLGIARGYVVMRRPRSSPERRQARPAPDEREVGCGSVSRVPMTFAEEPTMLE